MSAQTIIKSCIGTAFLCVSLVAGADIAALVTQCDGCHGQDGVSEFDDMPTIAGMSSFGHADALFLYKDEGRPCAESKYRHGDTERAATTMCAVVADMSEDDMEAIAEYYSAKSFVAATQKFDAALAERGGALHEEHCDRCHTDGGSNPDDDAGILAGQRMGYLQQSFADYASGERDQPEKMKTKLDKLGAEDVEALVHYYASQQ